MIARPVWAPRKDGQLHLIPCDHAEPPDGADHTDGRACVTCLLLAGSTRCLSLPTTVKTTTAGAPA